uniref:hypothetical protein n=1 Tax=Dielma fastidiosa TaxID=1034346 RepID=UPI0023F46940
MAKGTLQVITTMADQAIAVGNAIVRVYKDLNNEIVFEDYLNQVLKKEQYTLNDLLLIKYYSVQCQSSSYDESMIENFRKNLIKQRLQGDELTNVELLGALSAIAGIYVMHHEYEHMKSLVDKMYEIIHSIMQHSYQPGITMLEAKYYLF